MRVILASKSPRRKELLAELFSDFDIITAETDESLFGMDVIQGVRVLSERKGRAVLDKLLVSEGQGAHDCLIISSDTLVELGGVPFGKPRDEDDARAMLSRLSGRGHNVHTGVAVHYRGKVYSGVATTKVYFRELADAEIDEYIASGEPMDKAGAYGIQGGAGRFVEHILGDFDTVVGLPLAFTKRLTDEAIQEGKK